MPLKIIRNDITKLECDAIVNAANSTLLGGGGVDGAIHKAAGKGLLIECMKLGGCKPGNAKVTSAYNLPCKYVIHTVGPKWRGGDYGEKAVLASCYRTCLNLAVENKCESVAFPLISSGIYGYPKDQALKVAVDIISGFLLEHDILVYIVVFDKSAYQISEKLFTDIASYIDDKYVEKRFYARFRRQPEQQRSQVYPSAAFDESRIMEESDDSAVSSFDDTVIAETTILPPVPAPKALKQSFSLSSVSLDEMISQIDESFSQMLLRKIDEKGMTDAECYKKANIDRKLFSKIRNDVNYKPSKTTAIAFAISLELSLPETKDLLMKAGYALSRSNKFDIIIEYFISKGIYNVFEINEALFAFDQSLLGY